MPFVGAQRSPSLQRRSIVTLLAAYAGLLLCASPAAAQGGLTFFKSYFVTGDYVASGVALRGTGVGGVATGTIRVEGVPENVDILAAFLYWQTVLVQQQGVLAGTAGATFAGESLDALKGGVSHSLAKPLNPGTAPCWSSGGSTGASNGTHRRVTYRADVLRVFQDPGDVRKFSVNGDYTVTLPDAGGTGNLTPSTTGASLVLIYRAAAMPLRSIVIYDGGFTKDNRTRVMNVTLNGFYQPLTSLAPQRSPTMTHIVGDGQANFFERVLFNGQTVGVGAGLFASTWDTRTFAIDPTLLGTTTTVNGPGVSATVSVTDDGGSADCLSWGAVILSAEVQDSDEDGLLDLWESTTEALPNPNGGSLPLLSAMGADPCVRDLFVEVGYMRTNGYRNDAQVVSAHTHLPDRASLEMVAQAFHNAPPKTFCKSSTGPINVHFDVGNNYQTGLPSSAQCRAAWQASCAIVRAGDGARGGDAIDEVDGCSTNANGITTCGGFFPNYPGTVGWKSGFNLLKNRPLGFGLSPVGPSIEEQCLAAGAACVRRFDRNRKDIFRYALFAHAVGLPRVDRDGRPVQDPHGPVGARIPKNTSGIADGGGVGGGDSMVTLGFWDEFRGSTFMQASTLLHELGHTLGLRHGGGPPAQIANGEVIAQPNCKPNYLSIMNYLFQVRGLVGANGVPTIDFSRQTLGSLNEGSLTENLTAQPGWATRDYRTRWHAPLANVSALTGLLTRRCDGRLLDPGEGPLVRVDEPALDARIDWNQNGDTTDVGLRQDINFNGGINDGTNGQLTFIGFDDFAAMDLRQVGGRRNAGSQRIGGALSLDVGFGDVGFGDVGFGDVGFGDVGFGDVGFGDVGFGDVGFGDVGFGDVGFGDVGFGDVGFGDVGAPRGDLDLETASELNGPNALTATALQKAIRLTWSAPHVGSVQGYNVYRVVGGPLTSASKITRLGASFPTTTALTFDDVQVKNNLTYSYFVVAMIDGAPTGPSNVVTIRK